MQYVKLVAKPDTWFKAGTEAYHYDAEPTRRLTLDEWKEWQAGPMGIVLVSGTRISEHEYELKLFGPGERLDGECCGQDEFEVEIVEEPL